MLEVFCVFLTAFCSFLREATLVRNSIHEFHETCDSVTFYFMSFFMKRNDKFHGIHKLTVVGQLANVTYQQMASEIVCRHTSDVYIFFYLKNCSWNAWNFVIPSRSIFGTTSVKMTAKAEQCLLSSLVWFDSGVVVSQHRLESFSHEIKCNGMTSFMEFMFSILILFSPLFTICPESITGRLQELYKLWKAVSGLGVNKYPVRSAQSESSNFLLPPTHWSSPEG